jgi:hypothetical protein
VFPLLTQQAPLTQLDPLGQQVLAPEEETQTWPLGQQLIPTQTSPLGQQPPLVPQVVAVCDAKGTQAPLLVQQPPGQVVALHLTHFPLLQNWPLEHFWLQPPQLLGSVCVFVQVPLQQVGAVGGQGVPPLQPPHMHLPLQQLVLAAQPPEQPPEAAYVVCGRTPEASVATSPIPPPRNLRRETSPARARVKSSNR